MPPAATPVHSPPSAVASDFPLSDRVGAFGVSEAEITEVPVPGPVRVDRRRDLLISHGRSARTCREPVDFAYYDSRRLLAVLCGRERVVRLFDRSLNPVGSAPAGTGPSRIASDGRAVLYVTDAVGKSLLVYHLHPRFELIRRVSLPGAPSAIARDGDRLRLTVAGRELEFAAGSRPVPCTRSPRC